MEAWKAAPYRLTRDDSPIYLRGDLSDEDAESAIRDYLTERGGHGLSRVTLLDIVANLGIPPTQVELVMNRLAPEGVAEVRG